MMQVSLKLQKRLAASVLGCGKRKIWLDPTEINEISMANSRACPLPPQRTSHSVSTGPVPAVVGRADKRQEAEEQRARTGVTGTGGSARVSVTSPGSDPRCFLLLCAVVAVVFPRAQAKTCASS